jgi:membrane-bound lytic murein transglycosylase A
MNRRVVAALFFIALVLASAAVWRLLHRAAPAPLQFAHVHFSDLPDWNASDPRAALLAFQRSCTVMMAAPPETVVGAYAGSVADWRGACDAAAKADVNAARDFFEQWFAPLAVSAGNASDGLFTGYYEPLLHASIARHGRYQTPVYALPSDLVTVDLGRFRDKLKGEHVTGRVEDHRLAPYPTRADIDTGGLSPAKVLFYADDPVAVFFLHIQGSGRVSFDDGTAARVAYDGQNGQPYTAIGRTLIAEHQLTKDKTSLQTIRAWLQAHPTQARAVMESDASFVFFKQAPVGDPALGAVGAEGVALTPEASIAVDAKIHPLGAPFFIVTSLPRGTAKLNRLFVAQDTGGAIAGPVRADIFFGFGARAEDLAGEMKQTGRMFVLLPKQVAARIR